MTGILFLAHRLPFPPDRGDKIRSHHLLRALAELAPVHVGCFAESPADYQHEHALKAVAASHCMPLRDTRLLLAGLKAVLKHEPVSLAAFRDATLANWVQTTLATHAIDTIYVFSGQMGQYVPDDWNGRLIVDLVDVDSAKFEAYATDGNPVMRWVNAREARLLRTEEQRLAAQADHVLLISRQEADLFRSRIPASLQGRVRAMGNGIDVASYDPAAVTRHAAFVSEPGPHLLFTGQMDYAPNIEAVERVVRQIMPGIRRRHPGARFHVVGRAPTAEVRALDGVEGCHIWGEVADVRPFLRAADLVVAPLTIARGVQNKVLEAMAMARAVVLTPPAATGIPATDGVHLAIAEQDDALIDACLRLLAAPDDRAALGGAARDLVSQDMNWPAMLVDLAGLVSAPPKGAHDDGRRDAA
ncbi:TIGR03087 family PEP-CTERM/XrtA system glycosyltransferase [Altererythrobacter xixiisoli]|uniref:TIGR03087 family PEP-CTERM/XrtA system glycosyltransferase n=1 Tax=Croceibacterium xixiisoli TaxID=1476466 RepID=A0A6I4TUU3_9SPHN|nr:TIGR03087 family PEP-CTERM/XrtA system glycosyltransferase [Croceibacterium xixiisoli]MXO99866.1 TIGR03087 family PEP-CTERM/XrtA system glycosyltransferase [Croceibacterium xixiisoli]